MRITGNGDSERLKQGIGNFVGSGYMHFRDCIDGDLCVCVCLYLFIYNYVKILQIVYFKFVIYCMPAIHIIQLFFK